MSEFVIPSWMGEISADHYDTYNNPKWDEDVSLSIPASISIVRDNMVISVILPDGTEWIIEDGIPTWERYRRAKEMHRVNQLVKDKENNNE